MQAFAYQDVRESSSDVAREQERLAFDQAIALMEGARSSPDELERRREATRTVQILWGYLIRDLSNPANDLSDELKGNLISIGLWVVKEADSILAGESENWAGLIDINRTIREGLAA